MESNHLMPPYQDGATRRALPEWIPAGDSNSPLSITEAADRHLSLPGMDLAMGAEPIRQKKQNWSPAEEKSAYPIYKTGASPSMLAGLIYACSAHLHLHDISGAGYGTRTRVRRLATFDPGRQLGLNQ